MYFSGVFAGVPQDNNAAAKKSFHDYISAKYSLTGTPACSGQFFASDTAKREMASDEANYGSGNSGYKIVQTDWQFDPAAASAVTPAASATGGSAGAPATGHPRGHSQASDFSQYGPGRGMWCQFTPHVPNFQGFYDSNSFQANAGARKIQQAFVDYISAKYSIPGTASCSESETLEKAEAQRTTLETNLGHQKFNIIQTGWTYDPATVPPPDNDKLMLQEADRSKQYCSTNDVLSGLYDCSCFTQHFLAYRKEHGTTTPFINAVQPVTQDPHFSECAGPSTQVAAYGEKRAQAFLRADTQYAPRAESISKCATDGFTNLFLAKPIANTVYIDGYFTTAISRCVEKTN
jgi:hypothetical protein